MVYSYLYDGKGNVTTLLDGNAHVAATYQYDPFGTPRQVTGDVHQPMQFSTKPYDEKTGLSYYGYRFYVPALGRWLTRDPIGEAGGINLYGFVGNSPVNWVDPLGLIWANTRYSYHWGSAIGWSAFNRWSQDGSISDDMGVNTTRDAWQDWVPDPENPDRDNEYPPDTKRKIPQKYCIRWGRPPGMNDDNPNAPRKNKFYNNEWNPWVNNNTYENYPGQTIYYPPSWRQR